MPTRRFRQKSLASAAGLYRFIQDANPKARMVLFETWARTNGAPAAATHGCTVSIPMTCRCDCASGTRPPPRPWRISGGAYVAIARVGEVWQDNYHAANPIRLHDGDGSHPDFAGSYVAALDIFATVYYTSPLGVTYRGPLSEPDAARLRQTVSLELSRKPTR